MADNLSLSLGRKAGLSLILLLLVVVLPLANLAGGGAADTRNFDNFQHGIIVVNIPIGSQGILSPFIPFNPVYSTLPNMTYNFYNGTDANYWGLFTPITQNVTFQIPFVVTAGYTAPTWIVQNAETEIFGNTQDEQVTNLNPLPNSVINFQLGVNVISHLPVGDNGRLWIQYSVDAGATWHSLDPNLAVTCANNGLLMTTNGIHETSPTASLATGNLATVTRLRITGCNGNGVGSVTIGGVWVTFGIQITQNNLPPSSIALIEPASPDIFNETTSGFNILVNFPTQTQIEGSLLIGWSAWLPSRTCQTGCI